MVPSSTTSGGTTMSIFVQIPGLIVIVVIVFIFRLLHISRRENILLSADVGRHDNIPYSSRRLCRDHRCSYPEICVNHSLARPRTRAAGVQDGQSARVHGVRTSPRPTRAVGVPDGQTARVNSVRTSPRPTRVVGVPDGQRRGKKTLAHLSRKQVSSTYKLISK
jgi:hypothetical protein